MKIKIINLLISLFVIFSININAQNTKALDEKNGFREVKFEMLKDSIKNLIEIETDWYYKSDENLTLGEYSLYSVNYGFYKNQLAYISIKTKGYSNSRGVLSILQKAYGNGYKSNQYIEDYSWYGSIANMVYKENSITNDASILMWSQKISDLKRKEKEKSDLKATEGL